MPLTQTKKCFAIGDKVVIYLDSQTTINGEVYAVEENTIKVKTPYGNFIRYPEKVWLQK